MITKYIQSNVIQVLISFLIGYFISKYFNHKSELIEVENKEEKKKIPIHSEKIKMVLLVREDLGMSSGKIAAQCSHVNIQF